MIELDNNSKIVFIAMAIFIFILGFSIVYATTGYPSSNTLTVTNNNTDNSSLNNNQTNTSTGSQNKTLSQKEIDEAQHNAIPPQNGGNNGVNGNQTSGA